jgi:hypothetical protein
MACVDFSFVRFGDCSAKPSKLTIDVNQLSSQIIDSVMKTTTISQTDAIVSQEQNITIRGPCCSPVKIDQLTEISLKEDTKIDTTFSIKIANQIKTNIDGLVDSKKSLLDSLVGEDKSATFTNSVKQSVQSIINTSGFQESIINSFNKTIGAQIQNVEITCSDTYPMPPPPENSNLPDSACLISQKFLLQLEINNLFKNVFTFVLSDPNVKEAIKEISNETLKYKQFTPIEKAIEPWYKEYKTLLILLFILFFLPSIISIITKIIKK